jgi:DNA-binding NarL/FixJ family response regulator
MAVGTRILVVHQSPLMRDCLAMALSDGHGLEAIALDHSHLGWASELVESDAGILVVDLGLPDQAAKMLIAHARRAIPDVAIVALVSQSVERDVMDAVTAGATVCVPERSSLQELRTAICYASRRESYCSPLIAHDVLAQLGKLARSVDWVERAEGAVLSAREFEVLRLIAEENLSNKEIARALNISLYTVKNHVHNILEKISVQDRHAAADYAKERAWI